MSDAQVRSLKSLCDRLPRLAAKRGRRWIGKDATVHASRRPWRDHAIVFVLLSTGLRREELVQLDLDQVQSHTPGELVAARRATVTGVCGKGRTQRTVFLSADARTALADYLTHERPSPKVHQRCSSRRRASLPARLMGGSRPVRSI